jgi:transcriptional regulator with XRE-family HTH domain
MVIKLKKHTNLGMRIAKSVGLSGKNQASFAMLLGVHPSNLNRWISGEVAPSYEYISKIGFYSGVSLDWLMTGEEPMVKTKCPEKKMTQEEEGDEELKEIINILKHDLPELKKHVLKILRGRKEIKEGIAGIHNFDKSVFDENA